MEKSNSDTDIKTTPPTLGLDKTSTHMVHGEMVFNQLNTKTLTYNQFGNRNHLCTTHWPLINGLRVLFTNAEIPKSSS